MLLVLLYTNKNKTLFKAFPLAVHVINNRYMVVIEGLESMNDSVLYFFTNHCKQQNPFSNTIILNKNLRSTL